MLRHIQSPARQRYHPGITVLPSNPMRELPELQTERDVMWIYEKLMVHASDEEASIHFRQELQVALDTRFTRLNDATHMLAHA